MWILKKNNVCLAKNLIPGIWYFSLYIVLTGVLLLAGYSTIGPFIFGDESTYFAIARNMAELGEFVPDNQYNPLYPFLVAPAFHIFGVETVYLWARILNAASFALAAVPIYFFSLEVGFAKRPSLLLAILAVLLPAGAYVHVIWADPLMFPLIASGSLFALRYFKTQFYFNAFLAGAFFGTAYLAKQYGLGLAAALAGTVFIWAIFPNTERKKRFLGFFGIVIGAAIFAAPLLVRNALKHKGSVLGYQSHLNEYWLKYQELGLIDFSGFVLEAVLFQISGIIFSTWGLVLIVVMSVFFMWRFLPKEQILFAVFLLIGLSALIGVSSVHLFSYELSHLPNGRYYNTVTPLIMILGLRWSQLALLPDGLDGAGRRHFLFSLRGLSIVSGIAALVVWYFSPLKSLIALSLVHNPETSFLNLYLNNDNIPWTHGIGPAPVNPVWQWLVASVPVVMIAILLFGLKRFPKIAVPVVICVLGYQSFEGHRYLRKLGQVHHDQNAIVRFAAGLKEKGISVGYDKESFDGSAMFFSQFWYGPHVLPFYDPLAFIRRADFVFGPDRGRNKGTGTFFDRGPNKQDQSAKPFITFLNPEKVNSRACIFKGATHNSEFVAFGTQPSVLRGNAKVGIHRIGITLGPSSSCGGGEVRFDVTIQGKVLNTFTAHPTLTVTLEAEVDISPGPFEIGLVPHAGKIWAIKGLTMRSLADKRPEVLISSKDLPVPILKEIGKWKAYDGR